jgi:diadenosine tetraphosphate (Ap4A) HIT family hydrolase
MDCVLCNALTESYRIVYKDKRVVVIVNIEPVKNGHLMIMPVRHAEQLGDLQPEEAQAFLRMIDRCMHAVERLSDEPSMCLVNGWKHRTQPHLHAHVLPSKKNLRGLFSASEGLEERKRADAETLALMADELRVMFS